MKMLENQILYQCEYCNKRFVTSQGAKRHERKYCYLSPIPEIKRKEEIQKCDHEWNTFYDYIPGEAVMEPQYDYCVKCSVNEMEWRRMEGEKR